MTNKLEIREELRLLRKKLNHHHNIDDLLIEKRILQLEKQMHSEYEFNVNQKFLALSTLAIYYRHMKNYDKSAKFLHQAIRLTKEVSMDYIEEITETYLEYAGLERNYHHYANARIELAKLLAFMEKHNISDAFFYGEIYYSLGITSIAEENLESGINQLQKAFECFQQVLPITHPKQVKTIHTLSNALLQFESYQPAIQLYQALREAYHNENNTVFEARALLKIGEINFYIDLKAARKIITKAIKLFNDSNENTGSEFTQANLMLAEIDEHIGNYPRAITYYKRAADYLESCYQKNPFLRAYIYSKIGMISLGINELDTATEYLEKGLNLSKEFPPLQKQFLYGLGEIYAQKKQYSKLLAIFQEIKPLEKNKKKPSKAYANLLQTLGLSFSEQKRFTAAISYYEDALAIYHTLTNSKEEKGLTYIRLAYCREYKKEIATAERYYEKGVTILEKTRNKERLRKALTEIVEFYTRYPNADKRNKYTVKLLNLGT